MGLPGSVYRLGNVGGPTTGNATWNGSDANLLFIRQALQCGKVLCNSWEP